MKKRNLLMSTALMSGLLSIAFTFDQNGIYWLWADRKPAAAILIVLCAVLCALWFRASKGIKTPKQG